MLSIGGYLPLELPSSKRSFHKNMIELNSGRNSFEYILKIRRYKHLYIPKYICPDIIKNIKNCNINLSFYSLNRDMTPNIPDCSDAVMLVDYFGVCSASLKHCLDRFPSIIIDNTQAFFSHPNNTDSFYSPRKFFGIPDGGYAYLNKGKFNEEINLPYERSSLHCNHLLKRIDTGAESGYNDYCENESYLAKAPLRKMSRLSQRILLSIDYEVIRDKRNRNFNILHSYLGELNNFPMNLDDPNAPLCYPFLHPQGDSLRNYLISIQKCYVPVYWRSAKNFLTKSDWENELVSNLVPLPISQNCSEEKICQLAHRVKSFLDSE